MKRNQISVIASVVIACIGVYLFAETKKPQEAKVADSTLHNTPETAKEETLHIEEYIADINSRIEDKAVREKIETSLEAKNYKDAIDEYRKLDKPLAVAWYSVKVAEQQQSAKAFVEAGDYNSLLIQTAPDAKAKSF